MSGLYRQMTGQVNSVPAAKRMFATCSVAGPRIIGARNCRSLSGGMRTSPYTNVSGERLVATLFDETVSASALACSWRVLYSWNRGGLTIPAVVVVEGVSFEDSSVRGSVRGIATRLVSWAGLGWVSACATD